MLSPNLKILVFVCIGGVLSFVAYLLIKTSRKNVKRDNELLEMSDLKVMDDHKDLHLGDNVSNESLIFAIQEKEEPDVINDLSRPNDQCRESLNVIEEPPVFEIQDRKKHDESDNPAIFKDQTSNTTDNDLKNTFPDSPINNDVQEAEYKILSDNINPELNFGASHDSLNFDNIQNERLHLTEEETYKPYNVESESINMDKVALIPKEENLYEMNNNVIINEEAEDKKRLAAFNVEDEEHIKDNHSNNIINENDSNVEHIDSNHTTSFDEVKNTSFIKKDWLPNDTSKINVADDEKKAVGYVSHDFLRQDFLANDEQPNEKKPVESISHDFLRQNILDDINQEFQNKPIKNMDSHDTKNNGDDLKLTSLKNSSVDADFEKLFEKGGIKHPSDLEF